jgi:hypothetical protein
MVMKVVCLVLVLTAALSSGGEEKKKTTLSAALTPADLARLKNVLTPGWDLSDPLLTAYALLSYDHLNLPYVRPAAVSTLLNSKLVEYFGQIKAVC